MDKLKRFATVLKENVDLAASLLGLLGFGSAMAFMDDARAMLCDHPVASVLLCLASVCGGYFLATGSGWAKARRKVKWLARVFATMPRRRKDLVAKALDEGEVECWVYDPDATTLMNLGILGGPPVASRTMSTPLSVQPRVVLEIKRHREEWLG